MRFVLSFPFTLSAWVKGKTVTSSRSIISLTDKDNTIPIYRIGVSSLGAAIIGARDDAGNESIVSGGFLCHC